MPPASASNEPTRATGRPGPVDAPTKSTASLTSDQVDDRGERRERRDDDGEDGDRQQSSGGQRRHAEAGQDDREEHERRPVLDLATDVAEAVERLAGELEPGQQRTEGDDRRAGDEQDGPDRAASDGLAS